MPSAVGAACLFAVLVVANCYVIKQVPHEKIKHAKHVNISEGDEFTVSNIIEKANKNFENDLEKPIVDFGDIVVSVGFKNADPCTNSYCKWKKSSDGNVYIPYAISNEYLAADIAIIQSSLEAFSKVTCIRFYPHKGEKDYIYIRSLSGCFSYVGRTGGQQIVYLQKPWCVQTSTVQHEFLHALGFHHEQNRSDRDQHVKILFENLINGTEHYFDIVQTNNLETSYDYNSVMQYYRTAFSKDGHSETIRPIPDPNVSIGLAKEMNKSDILRVNRLYQCKQYL